MPNRPRTVLPLLRALNPGPPGYLAASFLARDTSKQTSVAIADDRNPPQEWSELPGANGNCAVIHTKKGGIFLDEGDGKKALVQPKRAYALSKDGVGVAPELKALWGRLRKEGQYS